MAKVVKRTFSLTAEQAKFIDQQVETGRYASGSEVIREGLREMQEDAVVLERWITQEVLPTIAEYEKDPSQLIPVDQAFVELRRHIKERETDAAPKRRRRA
jgi:antitoxin ParD1/3/4